MEVFPFQTEKFCVGILNERRHHNHMKHLIVSLFITLILTCLACGALSADHSEDQKIQQITNNLLDLMNQQYYKHGNNRLRMAHVKQHGCVRGTLNVIPNLPPTLAQGN
jgi:hypothetical protein